MGARSTPTKFGEEITKNLQELPNPWTKSHEIEDRDPREVEGESTGGGGGRQRLSAARLVAAS